MSKFKTSLRTHTCDELRIENVNEDVTLVGWVDSIRDHGGLIFIDLRDRYGITQVTVRPEENCFEEAQKLKNESVISVTGKVLKRTASPNPRLATGEIELDAENLKIFSASETLPFEIDKSYETNETLRLKYRYLDLRNKKILKTLEFRHKLIEFARKFFYEKGFLEVQTPLLTSSTPEGARDFLVPSRIYPGNFYALPQSPQQYKQLLMIAGFDRYFQVAPCLRDEDTRADRLYGDHYQFDIEMSFATQKDIFEILSEFYEKMISELSNKKIWKTPIPVYSYEEVMNRYGSDKPDLRYDIEIFDVKDIIDASDFSTFKPKKFVRAIQAPKSSKFFSRTKVEEYEKYAKDLGASGLAFVKIENGNLQGGISKFFSENLQKKLIERTKTENGDLLFFIADDDFEKSCLYLDKIRRKLGEDLKLVDENILAFLWVTDFTFFELNDEGNLDIKHNPFSKPDATISELKKMSKEELLQVKAKQYDIVCNGYELLSGGERNYDREILNFIFQILGYSENEIHEKFGHMLEAFKFGAPPTAGAGIGMERILMILTGETNVRNIVAFPKDAKGFDPMMNSPNEAMEKQLKELKIEIEKK